MTIEQLREFHRAQPFQPFKICLADGRELKIPHPEWLSMSASGRTVYVSQPDDSFRAIDLLLVTSLDRVNGHSKRRAK